MSGNGSGQVGLRGTNDRRGERPRRNGRRHGRERRRGDRRRAGMRTLLLTAAALSAPQATRVTGVQRLLNPRTLLTTAIGEALEPSVEVAITSVNAIEASHAYDAIVAEAAKTYGLDPRMIKAVMQTESSFDATAVSPAGALGLMQLMPAVAAELGVTDPLDPRQNIMAGSKYLKQLLDLHGGNVRLALASYNAGPGNVAKYRAVPPFKETRNYVKNVVALLAESDD
jgi:soluble lytic murein transglycosylase-like protein